MWETQPRQNSMVSMPWKMKSSERLVGSSSSCGSVGFAMSSEGGAAGAARRCLKCSTKGLRRSIQGMEMTIARSR